MESYLGKKQRKTFNRVTIENGQKTENTHLVQWIATKWSRKVLSNSLELNIIQGWYELTTGHEVSQFQGVL